MYTTLGDRGIEETVARALGQQHQEQVDAYRQMQETISRALGGQPDPTTTIRRCIGADIPDTPPRAKATGRDVLSLFIPATSWDGSWESYQAARDKAVAWVRRNRTQIVDGHLCCGASFALDPQPSAYRDDDGTLWINCSIQDEYDYWRIKAGG